RGFSSGFYLGKPISAWCDSYGSKSTEKKELVGKVINYYDQKNVVLVLVQSNEFAVDDELLIMGTTSGLIRHKVTQIRDEKGKSIKKALKGTQVTLPLPSRVRSNDDVYVVVAR
ncbi:MAG: U32 family peptidase C-terminal domain-containing protein, partial [Candidatus Woesearchaeota archaeon]